MKATSKGHSAQLKNGLVPWLAGHSDSAGWIAATRETLGGLVLLDLEPVRAELDACYVPHHGGSPRRDSVTMLRSFVAMAMEGEPSVNRWHARLVNDAGLCLLCGFPARRPPAVATFYRFVERIVQGAAPVEGARGRSGRGERRRVWRRRLRREKAERQAAAVEQPVRHRAERTKAEWEARGRSNRLQSFYGRLQALLMRCGVAPSVAHGLLDPRGLHLACDATPLTTHASPRGHRLHASDDDDAPERLYSDPTATWGYQASTKKFFFGHKAHAFVAHSGAHDLPLWVTVDEAHSHEAVTAARDLADLYALLGDQVGKTRTVGLAADAAYDATALYELAELLGAPPIIPLNPRTAPTYDDEIERDADGRPLCPGRAPMRYHGWSKRDQQAIYNCPAKTATRRQGKYMYVWRPERCPLGVKCEPDTTLGPLVHIRPGSNPRMNLPIPRESEKWKALYRDRTTCERFFSTLKVACGLGRRPYRRRYMFQMMATCIAIASHVKAWLKEKIMAPVNTLSDLTAALDAMMGERLMT